MSPAEGPQFSDPSFILLIMRKIFLIAGLALGLARGASAETWTFIPYATKDQLGGTPSGVSADAGGNIYITSSEGGVITQISSGGSFTVAPLASSQPTPGQPYLQIANHYAVDSAGNLYTANGGALTRTTPAGVTTVLLPTHTATQFPYGGSTQVTLTYGFTEVAVDAAGNVYASEQSVSASPLLVQIGINYYPVSYGSPSQIFRLDGAGGVTTVVDGMSPSTKALVVLPTGTVIWSQVGTTIMQMTGSAVSGLGAVGLPAQANPLDPGVVGMALDPAGRIYAVAGNTVYVGWPASHSSPLTVLFQPQGKTIKYGTSLHLFAAIDAGGNPANLQWYRDGVAIAGANGLSYDATLPGSYTLTVSNAFGAVTTRPALVDVVTVDGLSVTPIPRITQPPHDALLVYNMGNPATLSVAAVATLPLSYQWQKNGVIIPNATSASYAAGVSGKYTVVITTSAGSVVSDVVTVTLANRLANISGRAQVDTGAKISIAGFIIENEPGATKPILVRGIGPGLAGFGVSGALAHPSLAIFDANGRLIAGNSGWNNDAAIAAASASAGAFPLAAGSADTALILNLPPGAYTAQVTGADGGTGVALAEVYDLDPSTGRLANISNRAQVGTDANVLIGGLIIGGIQSSRVLVRAVGPGLVSYGVAGVLTQPVLSIYDANGKLIAANTGWTNGGSADAVAIDTAGSTAGAFRLQPGSNDCAVLLSLSPGAYTAQVTGATGSTGIALIEIYQVP